MANNRMFLVHVPTGLGCSLAKRMGFGWYRGVGVLDDELTRYFNLLEEKYQYGGDQDDFQLVLESSDDWAYSGETEDGFMSFKSH